MSTHPAKAHQRRALVVLGMHRSGTSALSGMLTKLGAKPPSNPIEPTEDNPKGYWEPWKIGHLHDRILKSADTRWHDWSKFDDAWLQAPGSQTLMDELANLVTEEFGEAKFFVLKDPRICRLMPLWDQIFDHAGITPLFILPLRHPAEVALSLQKRDRIPRGHAILLWLRHVLDAEAATRGRPRIFVRYPELLSNWRSVANAIALSLSITWPRNTAATEAKIEEFLEPSLRHHHAANAPLSTTGLDAWALQAYEALDALADRESKDSLRTLDRIRGEFDASAAIYAPLIHQNRLRYASEIDSLKAQSEALTTSYDELEKKHAALNQENQENYRLFQKAREDLLQTRSEMEQHHKYTERLSSESQAQLLRMAADISTAQAERDRAEEQVRASTERFNSKLHELQACLSAAQTERDGALKQLRASSDRADHQIRELNMTISDMESRMHALRNEERKSSEALHERCQELAEMTRLLLESEQKIKAAAQERVTMRAQHEEAVDALSQKIEDLHGKHESEKHQHAKKLNELEASIGQLRGALTDEQRRAKALENELELTAATITDYRMQLHTVHSSRLWRTTNALRGLIRRRKVAPTAREDHSEQELLSSSNLFDVDWYLRFCPDATNIDPIRHYLEKGAALGLDPGPMFSTSGYLARYPDVAASGINPLVHYIMYGRIEGRIIGRK